MKETLGWLLGMPNHYEDDHVLRRAVWVMLALTFFTFVGLTVSIDYVIRSNNRLHFQFAYEKSLCTTIERSRDGLNRLLLLGGQEPLRSIDCEAAARISP